ncbi:MAG: alpha/beta hydrolase [Thermoguttaceae bacterium]
MLTLSSFVRRACGTPQRRLLLFAAGMLATGFLSLGAMAQGLIFHPSRIDAAWRPPAWMRCEEVVIERPREPSSFSSPTISASAAPIQIVALYFPATDEPHETILYSHGNGGTVAEWGEVGFTIREKLGASVLVYDYQGYGKSEGKPSTSAILGDARAARRWLAARENIAERDIIVWGRSLGGAVTIDLAARDGARAMVVESTFTSLPEMAAKLLPFLPARSLAQFALREELKSLDKIRDCRVPLFLSHGTRDSLIPFAHGEQLFAASRGEPKRFFQIQDSDHNDPPPDTYYRQVLDFLNSMPPLGSTTNQ